ncbi:MAG: hypothetical protein LBF09_07655 [Odoribacteraceae bacterium]|jgi:hypothetical protein|nr:hypothetical protein [Odoribacteraceae bacterium]
MENIERIERFLHDVIVVELSRMQGIGLSYMPFVAMGQAIEVLGGFLDGKPMKARGQSARRFSACVNKLLGGKYRLANEKNRLHDALRNQMTHAFLPGKELLLLDRASNRAGYKHLQEVDGRLVLVSEDFHDDLCRAVERLRVALVEGRLEAKAISYAGDAGVND